MTRASYFSISFEVRKRDCARIQIVLHVPPLEPCLPDLPSRRTDGRCPEDVRRARLAVRRTVEHVRPQVDVVHLRARREAEAEARGGARAVIRSLIRGQTLISSR